MPFLEDYEYEENLDKKSLIYESCLFLNETSGFSKKVNEIIKDYNKFNRELLTSSLATAPNIALNNKMYINRMKKRVNEVKTEKEKEVLRNQLEKNLKGLKRNKNYWINKGNIFPNLDKRIKEKTIDNTIKVIEELLAELS